MSTRASKAAKQGTTQRASHRARHAPIGSAELGLAPLEVEAYAFLLGQGPSTGYGIAKALGRSISSVYKTVEGLERTGAVSSSDDTGSRMVRATPLAEFAATRRAALDAALTTLAHSATRPVHGHGTDDRVYRLHTREQVIEKARALLADATDFVIAVATPALVAELVPDLQRAAARAVHVGIKLFEPIAIDGVDIFLDHRGTAAVETGPGQWLVVSADGGEHVQALFDRRGKHLSLGFSTREALMNWNVYTGMGANLLLAGVRRWLTEGATAAQIEAKLAAYSYFRTARSDGKRALLARFGASLPPGQRGRQPG